MEIVGSELGATKGFVECVRLADGANEKGLVGALVGAAVGANSVGINVGDRDGSKVGT